MEDVQSVADLKPNPKNPRRCTDDKKAMLEKSLEMFGDISGVVFNTESKQLIGGHQRSAVFKEGEIRITQKYSPPDSAGTTAEGFIMWRGLRFGYREVAWGPQTELAANIAANKGAGDWDYTLLTEGMHELDHHNFDLDLTMHNDAERERLMAGWNAGTEKVEFTTENLDAITTTIKVKCPSEIKDEVLIYLKKKFLEVSFEGVEIV